MLEAIKQTSAVKPKFMKESENDREGIHLFVMVHGFQGNHNDLRGMRN